MADGVCMCVIHGSCHRCKERCDVLEISELVVIVKDWSFRVCELGTSSMKVTEKRGCG